MYLKSIGDCVRSRDESIDTPLDPPLFWLDNIFEMCFFNMRDPLHEHLSDCDDRLWVMLAAELLLQVVGSHRRRQQVEQLIIAAVELAR